MTAVLLRYRPFQPPLLLLSIESSQQSSLIQLQLVKAHGFLSAVTVIANRTLCQAYLLQVVEHQCPMYAAFATGSLTWHEVAKSNNAAEAKEAALKELYIYCNCNIIRECYQSFTQVGTFFGKTKIFAQSLQNLIIK